LDDETWPSGEVCIKFDSIECNSWAFSRIASFTHEEFDDVFGDGSYEKLTADFQEVEITTRFIKQGK
jgi:hypothetical protein